jgi:hypothetical protein
MYWENIVLLDVYMDYVKTSPECAIQKAQNKQTNKRPTYLNNLGAKPT